jgi:hypothetical protein
VSNVAFVTITSGATGSSNGSVGYSVASNPNTQSRSGTLTIAGQTFTVTQDAAGCTYQISPSNLNFVYTGGSSTVAVTAGSGCTWTAVSNAGFVTITGGASGTGNGTVSYTVAANPNSQTRSGTLTIAGQTFTMTQDPAPGCTYQISPTSQNFYASGGTGTINVTAPGGCSWAASTTDSFVTITSGFSGSGNGTVILHSRRAAAPEPFP